jgi:hypothetical protein
MACRRSGSRTSCSPAGPTEVRLLLIALNTAVALGFAVGDRTVLGLTPIDLAALGLAAGMGALLALRARRNLRALARIEPPRRLPVTREAEQLRARATRARQLPLVRPRARRRRLVGGEGAGRLSPPRR